MESSECGGSDFAKELILTVLSSFGSCNLATIGMVLGLPPDLLVALLEELEQEGRIKPSRNKILWKLVRK